MAYFDMNGLSAPNIYKVLASSVVPRPIAWVVTKSPAGQVNAAPFSLFNFFSGSPPVVCLGMGRHVSRVKDSFKNIVETDDFVINMVTPSLLEQMNTTAIAFPADLSEVEMAGIDMAPCSSGGVPRVASSPVALECRKWQVLELDPHNVLVMAHVLGVHLDEAVLNETAVPCVDGANIDVIGRLQSPGWYGIMDERFQL